MQNIDVDSTKDAVDNQLDKRLTIADLYINEELNALKSPNITTALNNAPQPLSLTV